ncbi:retrotransposon protein, putative, ty1-copia subclass [Tanacetum coccineum]
MMLLLTMDLEIQRNLAHLGANYMLIELKALYSKQAEQELLQTMRIFTRASRRKVNLVSLILVGLSKKYDSFVQNYNMHNMGKTVNELHAILKLHEETLPKKVVAHALYAIKAGKVQKNKNKKPSKAAKGVQGKGKGKKAYVNVEPSYAPKPKNLPPPKKGNPAKDAICHHCGEVGVFTIELYSFPSTSWVYDTGCGTLICNTTQGLRGSKKLNPGALSLYVGSGQREAVVAIGNYHLCLPSGLVVVLNNCHYAPFITRGIISVSRLYEDGFINRFELNNTISVSKNNVIYFTAIPRDGLYEIEMSCSNTNDSSMYVDSNKRAKLNLDSSLLWHCHLGHISKKRIEKLKHDGLLNSTDIESLGKCVSCMSGKMARKPYSHQVERAKDLLRLIHTDVCGPFRIVSRQGANYFVNFTDDFSRYGYVYLLKHKHEVFETFKVFQKEVENQLGKTIKSLWSDRGGEYMSQEFLDHLKEHGIIAHRTPPYTPQHNGVLERRNRTLLDMSVISEIDEPLSDINHSSGLKDRRSPRDRLCLYIDAEEHELGDLDEPTNYKAALKDLESEKWLAAMNVEMQSMKDNDVWELVELPPNAKTVGHKWLFKKKTDMDGAVHTFKSRLVAKGFTQTIRDGASTPAEKQRMSNVPYASAVGSIMVSGYTDAGYLTDADDLRSQTGYVFVLNGGVVDWKSTKQRLNVVPTIEEPITMYCDNTGAIAIANDHGVTKGARHFHAKVYYL